MSLFGFGKKDKPPYKTPREVIALRHRIDMEMRENYPTLVRYQEIAAEVEFVCRGLNAVIAQKEYAEEASRARDDLTARLSQLAAKISKNRKEAASGGKDDYLDSNLEYLQRKSVRNTAKGLSQDFLEQVQALRKCCLGERIEHNRTIESITLEMVKTLTALNDRFFKPHGKDREIESMKRDVVQTVGQLNAFLEKDGPAISKQGLEARTAAAVLQITAAMKDIA